MLRFLLSFAVVINFSSNCLAEVAGQDHTNPLRDVGEMVIGRPFRHFAKTIGSLIPSITPEELSVLEGIKESKESLKKLIGDNIETRNFIAKNLYILTKSTVKE